jgi:hypothetical protein
MFAIPYNVNKNTNSLMNDKKLVVRIIMKLFNGFNLNNIIIVVIKFDTKNKTIVTP